jgi:hypothetical protein
MACFLYITFEISFQHQTSNASLPGNPPALSTLPPQRLPSQLRAKIKTAIFFYKDRKTPLSQQ